MPDGAIIGDIIDTKIEEHVAEIERLDELATERDILITQLSPYTLDTATQQALLDPATHEATKLRIEEMVALQNKLDKRILAHVPNLTDAQKATLVAAVSIAALAPLFNNYME